MTQLRANSGPPAAKKDSSSTAAHPPPSQVQEAEAVAQRVVVLVRRVIDVLRSVDAFSPLQASKLALKSPSASGVQDVRLVPLFVEVGLVEDIDRTCTSIGIVATSEGEDIDMDESVGELDRQEVVDKVCVPLLATLTQCYAVLDSSPQSEQQQSELSVGDRRKERSKPPAPRGLLSIADYTDVACILEFLVCVSILPNLESKVLPAAEERARYLPKSLGGRLHRRSLEWGSAVRFKGEAGKTAAGRIGRALKELRQSSATIGRVLTLERFRPMLLPRHAADVIASLFQSDRYRTLMAKTGIGPVPDHDGHALVQKLFLGGGSRFVEAKSTTLIFSIERVDPHTRAKAFQTLLSGGRNAPPWIRRKAGSLLNSLAASNLHCVVDVFVVAASTLPTENISGASARLGRVLCSIPFPSAQNMAQNMISQETGGPMKYYQRLFLQLGLLLDAGGGLLAGIHNKCGTKSDPRIVAGVLTVWAVIENAPFHILEAFAVPILTYGLLPESKPEREGDVISAHTAVKRICSLLAFAPRMAIGLGNLYQLFLSPLKLAREVESNFACQKVTIFGQLLRIAAVQSDNSVENPIILQHALWVIQMLLNGMGVGDTTTNMLGLEGDNVLKAVSLALVDSVCINPLDISGITFETNVNVVTIKKAKTAPELNDLAAAMEKRARVLIAGAVAEGFGAAAEKQAKERGEKKKVSNFPSILFCLSLLIYFSDDEIEKSHTMRLLPDSIHHGLPSVKLATMAMLPLLCEHCSPSTLILGNPAGRASLGVLGMIRLIISSAASRYAHLPPSKMPIRHTGPGERAAAGIDYSNCDIAQLVVDGVHVRKIISEKRRKRIENTEKRSFDDDESILSISSVIISLLVALLELGEGKRASDEEETLVSLVPLLQALSLDNGELSISSDGTISKLKSEIAEMASHAVALIMSRRVDKNPPSRTPKSELLAERLRQAEKDLSSDQPPFRARGVVSLRHIAQGYLSNTDSGQRGQPKRPLIIEIGSKMDNYIGSGVASSDILVKLIKICTGALEDCESYVYLASIQTLVTIADTCPHKVMPLLGQAISLGKINFALLGQIEMGDVELSALQRIKLTEVLIFSIRRRGAALGSFGQILLGMMLYGRKTDDGASESGVESRIQIETDAFFKGKNDSPTDYEEEEADREEDRRLRVNTGGPVFAAEESDLVRAGCVSVVAELVCSMPSHALIGYCIELVHLGKTALSLDTSRPVRRAAASLSRELYNVLLGQVENVIESSSGNANSNSNDLEALLSFACAMVEAKEESLCDALRRCLAADDVDLLRKGERVSAAVKGKVRLADSATMARCQEALIARDAIDKLQVFGAAKLLTASKDQMNHDATAKVIMERLSEGTRGRGRSEVAAQALKGLQIDADKLELLD